MRVLVDSNVLLDVLEPDAEWYEWSAESIVRCATHGRLVINHVVFAEVSVGFDSIETLDGKLPREPLRASPAPLGGCLPRGQGVRTVPPRAAARGVLPLPDFYIGAHAAVAGMSLLTRDAGRYRTYFPTVDLIAPDIP